MIMATLRGGGVLAVACRPGAFDFATGERRNGGSIEQRHYHHIYPDALLKETPVSRSFPAIQCPPIRSELARTTMSR